MDYDAIAEKAKDANEHEAYELYLYAINTAEPYHRLVDPTTKSLARHAKRGKYDKKRAVVAWKRVVDETAKLYAKDFAHESDWNRTFSVADRCVVALLREDAERENVFWKVQHKEV